MLVYIPTLGREGKQVTLESIPERWADKVFLVCPKSESHEWKNRIDVPEECIGNIGKTRQWIITNSPHPHVAMIDDDIRISKREEEFSSKRYKLSDMGEFLDLMEEWLEEGDVYCGLSTSFMCQENPDEYYYGKPYGSHFLDRDYLNEKNIRFDELSYFEDFHVALSVLESGRRLRYTGKYIGQEVKANAPGGCSINRTSENNRQGMLDFAQKHPRYVTVKEEAGAKNQNIEVGIKLKIQFAKAYKENVVEDVSLENFF